jgi:serine protease Do
MAAGLPQTGFAKNDPEEVAMNRIHHGGAGNTLLFRGHRRRASLGPDKTTLVKEAAMTFSLRRRVGAATATTGVVVLSALALLAPAASASTSPPGATLEAQAEAVVQPSLVDVGIEAAGVVQVPMTDGSVNNYNATVDTSCSGAVVDPSGIILTAGHCADPREFSTPLIDSIYSQLASKGQTGTVTQAEAEQGWSTSTPQLTFKVYSLATVNRVAGATPMTASVVPGSDRPLSQGDVALLQVNPASPLPALQVAGANPTDGTSLVATGFPGAVTGNVDIDSLTPTLTPGQVTSTQALNAQPFTGVSATESPGMSGGPVVSVPDGAIYGTVSWGPGDPNAQQLNFATGTRTVQAELSQFHVSPTLDAADRAYRAALADYFSGKYREAEPLFNTVLAAMPNDVWAQRYLSLAKQAEPLESTGGSNLIFLIAGGAGLLVLAGGITFFLLLRRRHRTTAGPALAAPTSLMPAAQSRNGASCPACGATRTPGARFCSSCGEPYLEAAAT